VPKLWLILGWGHELSNFRETLFLVEFYSIDG
jgi:hypothetical protein